MSDKCLSYMAGVGDERQLFAVATKRVRKKKNLICNVSKENFFAFCVARLFP